MSCFIHRNRKMDRMPCIAKNKRERSSKVVYWINANEKFHVWRKNWTSQRDSIETGFYKHCRKLSRCLWYLYWKIVFLKNKIRVILVFSASRQDIYRSIGSVKPTNIVASESSIRMKKAIAKIDPQSLQKQIPHTLTPFFPTVPCSSFLVPRPLLFLSHHIYYKQKTRFLYTSLSFSFSNGFCCSSKPIKQCMELL